MEAWRALPFRLKRAYSLAHTAPVRTPDHSLWTLEKPHSPRPGSGETLCGLASGRHRGPGACAPQLVCTLRASPPPLYCTDKRSSKPTGPWKRVGTLARTPSKRKTKGGE